MTQYNLIYVGKFSDLDPVESFSIVSENQFDLNGRTFNPLSIVTLNAADAGLTWVGPPPAAIARLGDKVEAAYRRGDLFEKRRRLMDEWGTFSTTSTAPSGANVVPMALGRSVAR